MRALAEGTGAPSATGTAAQTSGPSTAAYAAKVSSAVYASTLFQENLPGNPEAEVEVRASPDGNILSFRLVKSSGVKSWDDAVLKAIDRLRVLPRNPDGAIPSVMIISHRPRK